MNNFGGIFNKINRGLMTSWKTSCWQGWNWIRQETGTIYNPGEVFCIPSLLKILVNYFSRYVEKEEVGEYNIPTTCAQIPTYFPQSKISSTVMNIKYIHFIFINE